MSAAVRWNAPDTFEWARRFVSSGPTHIEGPLAFSSLEAKLRAFRDETYLHKLPVLASPGVRRIDEALSLDARALHFTASAGDALQGAVRALVRPFEFELLDPTLVSYARSHSDYLEVSRLLVGANANDPQLAMRLLLAVGRWGLEALGCTGYFALCTGLPLRVFRKLGLTSLREGVVLPGRPNRTYTLLCGDARTLASAAMCEVSR